MEDVITKEETVRNMVVTRPEGHEKVSFNGIELLKNRWKGVIELFPQKLLHSNSNLVIITSPTFKGYFKREGRLESQIILGFSRTVQTLLIGTSTSFCTTPYLYPNSEEQET